MENTRALGLLHVYTGQGKGKSSAAFGLALRAWGHGLRVCVIQFMKSTEYSGEYKAVKKLKNIELRQFGTGRFLLEEISSQDVEMARDGMDFAREILTSGQFDVVILDELNVAMHFGLVDLDAVLEMIDARRPGVEVVVTGRKAPPELVERADYVTEMVEVKHPLSRGIQARKGIEY
jgi:cob(I)alamin adenosyltransferase